MSVCAIQNYLILCLYVYFVGDVLSKGDYLELAARFEKIYSNLPDGVRREIVALEDHEPYTWHTVYIEVMNNTGKSMRMLKKLSDWGVI
jgi:hypothetical protein